MFNPRSTQLREPCISRGDVCLIFVLPILLFTAFKKQKQKTVSQQKGVGPGNEAQWVREDVDIRIQTPLPNLQAPVSCQTPSPSLFLGMNPTHSISPSVSKFSLVLCWMDSCLSSPSHSCLTHFHTYHQSKWLQTQKVAPNLRGFMKQHIFSCF